MTTIPTDVAAPTYTATDEDGTIDAFIKNLGVDGDGDEDTDADERKRKKLSEETPDAEGEAADEDDADDEEPSDESPEGDEEGEDDETTDEEPSKKYVDNDDTYVKVKVGDEDKEVSVKDLKRLYGQEASLTRKSQEVADLRKKADEQIATNLAALNVMLGKAKERAKPYEALDWLAISKNPDISAAEAAALRDEAQAALADVQFFEKDLASLMTAITEKQKADTAAQAKVCIEALSTPGTDDKPNKLHIDGWNDQVYNDIRAFARDMGADAATVNALVDPFAFKVLHMAMQFQKGSSKVLTVKANKSPKKIVKTSSATPTAKAPAKVASKAKALANLKRSGSEEDAIDAFMASFAVDDE